MPIFMHKNPDEWRYFSCCGQQQHISDLTGFGDIGGPYCPVCEPDQYTDDVVYSPKESD